MRVGRVFQAAAILVVLCFAPAASAQSSPIVQHYRAYVAALERGDLPAATSEAQAALDASEARDGDGGRTAVLAFNVANAHLLAGNYFQARPSAQRALSLAQTGAEGVDPWMARIVVTRIALATDGGTGSAALLRNLLADQHAETLPAPEIYAAAAQLGNWGLQNRDYVVAQSAWNIAGARADGSPFGETYGLGRARTSEGIAIMIAELDRRRRIDEDQGIAAHALLSEGVRALYPLSQRESPRLELTLAQQTYAEARAWLTALESKMDSDGHDVPETPTEAQGDADGLSELGPVDLTRPRCMMRLLARPAPSYPSNGELASVVLFFRVGADGEIASRQVAARAGSPQFAQAIERVVDRWRFERLADSPANCRMESNVIQTVRFVMP